MNPVDKTLVLKGSEVRSLLDPGAAIEAVAGALASHARGETQMPSKVYISMADVDGDFRAMPVRIGERAGVKWINAHPQNPARYGLPSVIGVFILSDAVTARPLAIMDATGLTSLRTGAAAAVATHHLARPDASTLGIIGCGAQATSVIESHVEVMRSKGTHEGSESSTTGGNGRMSGIDEIRLHDTSEDTARRLADQLSDLPCVVSDLAGAASADVVCTLTPSRTPFIRADMLRPGCHINAMGADAPGKQELEAEVLATARVFLDDIGQATESGEVNVPLRDGSLTRDRIAGTLGDVIAGLVPGRDGADRTVFDSTGLAVQDLAVAGLVYERALERGIGLQIDLVDEN